MDIIEKNSIASFKPFLIARLRQYCTFQDSSVGNHFPKNDSCSTIKLFFLFKYVFHQPVLSKYLTKKMGGHRARLREKENLFRYRAQFEGKLLRFARARAHVRALMTRKSCAVRMRNAILRNYLNEKKRPTFNLTQYTFATGQIAPSRNLITSAP